jgi:flavin-binding protein dodecin
VTIVKIVELVGVSDKGWQDAVEQAVMRAAESLRNIRGVDVLNWTAKVKDGKIMEYRANVKISFSVEKVSE